MLILRAFWFILILSCCFPSKAEAWRWGAWRLRIKLQMSMEFDDNVRRIATSKPYSFSQPLSWFAPQGKEIKSVLSPTQIQSDGVSKWAFQLRAKTRSKHHIFQGSYGLGLKRFFWINGEDTINNQGNLLYYLRLHPRLLIGAQLMAGDLRRSNIEREYSYLTGLFRLMWIAPQGWRLSLYGGGGIFSYRNLEEIPEAHIDGISDGMRYSYHGDRYQVMLRKSLSRMWRFSAAYGFSRQIYRFRYTRDGQDIIPSLQERNDYLHGFSATIRFLRVILLQASYRFELMQSESIGESYYGHVVDLLFSSRLFWKIFLVIQGQLQLRSYNDGLSLNHNRFAVGQIPGEDENIASHVTVRLSRAVHRHVRVQLRYSFYTNLFSTQGVSYTRQLLSGGFSVQF